MRSIPRSSARSRSVSDRPAGRVRDVGRQVSGPVCPRSIGPRAGGGRPGPPAAPGAPPMIVVAVASPNARRDDGSPAWLPGAELGPGREGTFRFISEELFPHRRATLPRSERPHALRCSRRRACSRSTPCWNGPTLSQPTSPAVPAERLRRLHRGQGHGNDLYQEALRGGASPGGGARGVCQIEN